MCKVMSFHHHQYDMKTNSCTHKMNDDILEQVDTYKDLAVSSDPLLLLDQHISNAVSKAMPEHMQQKFRELSRDSFVTLYVCGKTPFRVCQHCLGTKQDM